MFLWIIIKFFSTKLSWLIIIYLIGLYAYDIYDEKVLKVRKFERQFKGPKCDLCRLPLMDKTYIETLIDDKESEIGVVCSWCTDKFSPLLGVELQTVEKMKEYLVYLEKQSQQSFDPNRSYTPPQWKNEYLSSEYQPYYPEDTSVFIDSQNRTFRIGNSPDILAIDNIISLGYAIEEEEERNVRYITKEDFQAARLAQVKGSGPVAGGIITAGTAMLKDDIRPFKNRDYGKISYDSDAYYIKPYYEFYLTIKMKSRYSPNIQVRLNGQPIYKNVDPKIIRSYIDSLHDLASKLSK